MILKMMLTAIIARGGNNRKIRGNAIIAVILHWNTYHNKKIWHLELSGITKMEIVRYGLQYYYHNIVIINC